MTFSSSSPCEPKWYRTPRSLKKCCTIDEGWKLLNFKMKVGQFIETGCHCGTRRHRERVHHHQQNIKRL
ncbi:hypothetical protein KCP69_26505 (plasmid) [Salmonella enterica subsp. enterica]|nr:hypothetical protein KCP69_26505 [Salmonella enterica subsp. enterica]